MGTCKINNNKPRRKHTKIEKFYKSDRWHNARNIVIARANGLCEECGKVGTEVHHIIHLTPANVDDLSVATNPDNLKLLCNECHNKVHGRFEGKRDYYFDEEGNMIKR